MSIDTKQMLFEPLQLGDLRLANRVVMAPMTRNRAGADYRRVLGTGARNGVRTR